MADPLDQLDALVPTNRRQAQSPTASPGSSTNPLPTQVGGGSSPLDRLDNLIPKGPSPSSPGTGAASLDRAASPHLPTSLVEEVKEYPKLLARASTENFNDLDKNTKELWKHNSLLGHAWSALKVAGDAASYVASPIQAAVELAAEPAETLSGVPGMAHKLGEYGSIASQFVVDPLAGLTKATTALGPITGVNKAVTAARESRLGSTIEGALSPTTKTTKVVTDLAGKVIPPDQVANFKGQTLIREENQAEKVGRIITKHLTSQGISGAQARQSLDVFQRLVAGLTPEQRIDFNLMMSGEAHSPLPTGMQPLADELRRLIDEREERLVSIGALREATGEYWPRLFKDPRQAQTQLEAHQAAHAQANARRPMQGSKRAAGLLNRTVPTLRESLNNGMQLVTDNPIELAILRMQGMDKYYYGTLIGRELKKQPYLKFLRWNQEHLASAFDLKPLDDKFFEARMPPAEVDHTFQAQAVHMEAYDPQVRAGLRDLAKFLQADLSRPLTGNDPFLRQNPGVLGYANRAGRTVSRFGNNDTVMMHELGHQINFKYRISDIMAKQDPTAWKELDDLALARFGGPKANISPGDRAYLLNPEEKIANLFHAYWYAPDLLNQLSPSAKRFLDTWLAQPAQKGLKGVVDNVRPSVAMGDDTRVEKFEQNFHKFFPGLRYLGRWYAPEAPARVFNNYVSAGNPAVTALADVIRPIGNFLNMAQLSLSAFHYSMVSADSAVSALTGLPMALRSGDIGRVGEILGTQVPLLGPIYSGIKQTVRGNRLRHAILDPAGATPELQEIANAFEKSGGRISMDLIHRSNGMGGFFKAIKADTYDLTKRKAAGTTSPTERSFFWSTIKDTFNSVKNPSPVAKAVIGGAKLAGRALETTMEPIMEGFVPRVKLGVFHDMASDFIKRNPHATQEEFIKGMQTAWESVDNRMGELVYDNLFWSKTLKDVSFLFVRAVGWNLGTERELGGGILDAIRSGHAAITDTKLPEITDRTKYTIALPITIAIQGAMLNYLYTGHGPTQILDYFYPKTGRTTSDGAPERVSMPAYIKDAFAYNYDPVGTVLNKLHPLFETGAELYQNKDYYGGVIASPLDKRGPVPQYLKYGAKQLMPFGYRGIQREIKEGSDWFPLLMSEFGFVPAPVSITNPKKNERYQEMQDIKGLRARNKEEARGQ